MELKYLVEEDDIVKDYLLKEGVSRTLGRKIKLYGEIYINSKPAKNYYPLKPGDILLIRLEEKLNPYYLPSPHPIEIVYEDEYLLVVNKPSNLNTQPSKKHFDDSLIARIKNYYLEKKIPGNVHVVTRLDQATSGLVLIAKNSFIHHKLQDKIEKKYLALVQGNLEPKAGLISLPIARLEGSSIKRQVLVGGKPSLTAYRVIKEGNQESLVELNLLTGRCHQLRVHLAHLGHPIIGDSLYGNNGGVLHLHAFILNFDHPVSQKRLSLEKHPNWI